MAGLVPFRRNRNYPAAFDGFYGMLDDFFSDSWPFRRSPSVGAFRLDVQESDREYVVEADLPGVRKEDVSLDIDDGQLKISVSCSEETEEKDKNYVHRERRYTSMARSVYLPYARPDGIKAKLSDGVLCVNVPKQERPSSAVHVDVE